MSRMSSNEQRTVLAGYAKVYGPNDNREEQAAKGEWIVVAPVALLTPGSVFNVSTKRSREGKGDPLTVTVQRVYKTWTVPSHAPQALVSDQWGTAIVSLPPKVEAPKVAAPKSTRKGKAQQAAPAAEQAAGTFTAEQVAAMIQQAVAAAMASVRQAAPVAEQAAVIPNAGLAPIGQPRKTTRSRKTSA